ncbi:MAG: hypothetical protein P8Y74_01315, partial [Desulfobacterales bacterium]
ILQFVQIDILYLLRLHAQVIKGLLLGAVIKYRHKFGQSATEGNTLVITESFSERVGAVVSLQIYSGYFMVFYTD